MGWALYILAGPLIWLTSLLLVEAIGARGCAPTGVVLTIQLLAVAGCVAVVYRALGQVRSPANAGDDKARFRHFMAGGAAVLSMAAIGAGTFFAMLTARC